jgi:hypothetical protein
MAETLTLTRLGITGQLKRTLVSTNPIESMIECVRRSARNVKRWSSGEMALRWTAAGVLEAERQLRRIIGYQQLAKLAVAIERDLVLAATTEEVATLVTASLQSGTAVEVLRRAGHPGCPLIVVSRQLGHASPNITATIDAHLSGDSHLDEAAAFERDEVSKPAPPEGRRGVRARGPRA